MATKFLTDNGYNKLNPATSSGLRNDSANDYNKYLEDEKIITKYKVAVNMALTDTSTWRNKQDAWNKQRMRIKKAKVFPFEGCSNLKMPTDERHIGKKKAKLANRIFGIRPIVQAVPPPSGKMAVAQKIEKFLDHLLMDVMNIYPKGVIAIDKMLESGFNTMKAYWRIEKTRRTETFGLADMSVEEAAMMFSHGTDPDWIKEEIIKRLDIDMNPLVSDENEKQIEEAIVKIYQGAEEVTIDVDDLTYNAPDVATPDAVRIIVPSESPLDPQNCEWICHDLVISYREFMSRAERGYKNIDTVSSTVTRATDPNFTIEQSKDFREGINRYQNGGYVRIWEIYTWEKVTPEDPAPRKCVITIAPEFNVVLRRMSLANLNGKFPFARINREIIDDRWYSPRGIPELITDIVREIDVQKNQRIDSQTARNAPMFMYRVGIVNPNIKLKPNKGIPVPPGMPFGEAFHMMNNTNLNAEFSYKDELQQLNAETEELLGEVNFTLQSQINKRQPRTGIEVDAQVQNMMPSTNLEGEIVANGFNELFNMIFALWCEFGDDEYEFQYFGNNADGKFETIKLTKEELQGHIISVRGNDSNTNPAVRMQKAMTIKQITSDQLALNMGLTSPMNVYNAQREVLQQLGVNPDMFVSPPPPPPPERPAPIKIGMEDLTAKEAMQVKMAQGIRPDVLGNLERDAQMASKHRAETAHINAKTMKENISEQIPEAITQ
jgi:hypothetical protein